MSLPALEEKMSLCRGTVWDSEVPLMQEVAEHLLTTKDPSAPVKNAAQPEKGLDWQCQNYKGEDKNACENAGCQLFEGKGMKICLNKKKTKQIMVSELALAIQAKTKHSARKEVVCGTVQTQRWPATKGAVRRINSRTTRRCRSRSCKLNRRSS